MKSELSRHDLYFMIETLMPARVDKEGTADRLQSDELLINRMLDDERLFQRLMGDENALLQVSPTFFFAILLRQARRDLQKESFTVERRARQKVVMFDIGLVVELLEQDSLRDYLAGMLASFVRIRSTTVPVQVGKGVWRRIRTNDLDVESLMYYAENVDEEFRFEPYKRAGDVCLFLASMFPEYIETRYRYPASRQLRPGVRGSLLVRLEDYESYGSAFYRLAAEHEVARMDGIDGVLTALSDKFILAEKPLALLSKRYLGFTRYRLFELQ